MIRTLFVSLVVIGCNTTPPKPGYIVCSTNTDQPIYMGPATEIFTHRSGATEFIPSDGPQKGLMIYTTYPCTYTKEVP